MADHSVKLGNILSFHNQDGLAYVHTVRKIHREPMATTPRSEDT